MTPSTPPSHGYLVVPPKHIDSAISSLFPKAVPRSPASLEVLAVRQHGSFCRRQDRVPGAGRDPRIRRRIAHDVDRVDALLDTVQLLPQKPPQHDDSGIRMRQVFERVDRDRALSLLRFEIV